MGFTSQLTSQIPEALFLSTIDLNEVPCRIKKYFERLTSFTSLIIAHHEEDLLSLDLRIFDRVNLLDYLCAPKPAQTFLLEGVP